MGASETQLVRYDAMVLAIAECHRVDEIKQIHDQAAALEAAARIAQNTDAERKAVEIRIRAERRAGELMKSLQRADKPNPAGVNQHQVISRSGMQPKPKSQYADTLERARIAPQTAHRWQQLAEVPTERFEAHLAAEEKPSSRAIVDSTKAKPQMSEEALWLWGRLRDYERMGMLDADPLPLIEEMTQAMRVDVRRLAPLVAALMNRCTEKEIG